MVTKMHVGSQTEGERRVCALDNEVCEATKELGANIEHGGCFS